MRKLCGYAILLLLAACQPSEPTAKSDNKNKATAQAPEMSPEERKKFITSITDRATSGRVDKFTGYSFWEFESGRPTGTPRIDFSLAEGSNKPYLLMSARFLYLGSDWVFLDRIRILADDVVVLDTKLEKEPFRKALTGMVMESASINISESDAKAFDKVAGSKTAVIRYSGQGYQDIVITDAEKKNLAKMVEIYDDIRKLNGLIPIGFERRTPPGDTKWHVTGYFLSKKDTNEFKEKAKNLGLDFEFKNERGSQLTFVYGPVREGYASAAEDLKKLAEAGITDFHQTKYYPPEEKKPSKSS